MKSGTLLQRIRALKPGEQRDYLYNFPKKLLEEFKDGKTEKLTHRLTEDYEFLEAILMLAVTEDGLSPTRYLLGIYEATVLDPEKQFKLCYMYMAIKDVANIIEEYPEQFASHLYSRLLVAKEIFPIISDISPTYSHWVQPLQKTSFLQRRSEIVTRHENGITHLIISPDSKKVISASSKTIKVYNKEVGYPAIPLISQQILIQHGDGLEISHLTHVRGLTITPDSQCLYSVCTLGIVSVWDLNTCLEITSYDLRQQSPEIEQGVTGMTMSGDGRYLYFADGVGSLHEFHAEECVPTDCRVRDNSNGIKQLIYSNQGGIIAALDRDGRVKIWCPAAYKCWDFALGERRVTCISFSPDGRRLLVATDDLEVNFIDITQRRIVSTVSSKMSDHPSDSIVLSADGTRLFLNDAGTLVVLNTETNDEIFREQIHGLKLINKMVLTENEAQIFTGDERGSVVSTKISGEVKESSTSHQSYVNGVAINHEGTIGISISDDGDRTWAIDTMENTTKFSYGDSLKDLAVTNLAAKMRMSGSLILSLRCIQSSYSKYSTKLVLWDFKTSHIFEIFQTGFDEEGVTAFNADHRFEFVIMATSCFRNQRQEFYIYLYGHNGDGYICYRTLGTHSKVTNAAHTSQASEVLVVIDRTQPNGGNPGRTLELFSLNHNKSIHRFYESIDGLEHLENTADYETLIATDSNKILIWNISSRLLLHTIETESPIEDMKVSNNGLYIITVDNDKTLAIWSLRTAEKITSYIHEEDFTCCAVSADGRILLAGDISGSVHGFRLKLGKS